MGKWIAIYTWSSKAYEQLSRGTGVHKELFNRALHILSQILISMLGPEY